MSQKPKVSIVVAAYNVERYLKDCVESLLAQSEKSLEVIIVDDGSTDRTAYIADEFAKNDSRVRPIHRPNGGLSVARNTGFGASRGEFVCFIDGDDWVEPDMVESMIAEAMESVADVVIAGVHVDFHDGMDRCTRTVRRTLPSLEIQLDTQISPELVDDNFVNLLGYAWNKLYKRDWLVQTDLAFEENLTLIEDIVFNADALKSAGKVSLIPGAFVHYIQRPRPTLGTTHDQTYLAKRWRAIQRQDAILENWAVDKGVRSELMARASGLALWAALRSAAAQSNSERRMREMMKHSGAVGLLESVGSWREGGWRVAWAKFTVSKRWFFLAFMPARAAARAGALSRRTRSSGERTA